jgi:hypothetical protein
MKNNGEERNSNKKTAEMKDRKVMLSTYSYLRCLTSNSRKKSSAL